MDFSGCPKCHSGHAVKNGIVKGRQRYKCKECGYNFSVGKMGRSISVYYVIKALQLYIEGVGLREIERLLGVSHVSVMNWIRKYRIQIPERPPFNPTYKVLNHSELSEYISGRENMKGIGMIITELGDKFMVISWERFKG